MTFDMQLWQIERNVEWAQERIDHWKGVQQAGWNAAAAHFLRIGAHKGLKIKLSKKKRIRIKQFSKLLRIVAYKESYKAHMDIVDNFKQVHERVLVETQALAPETP